MLTPILANQLPTRTDLDNAEVVFENATKEEFRFVDDVAQVRAACVVVTMSAMHQNESDSYHHLTAVGPSE